MNLFRFLLFLLFLGVALLGFRMGRIGTDQTVLSTTLLNPQNETHSFVIFIHASNQEPWCEKSLRSIFEQEYENYRVVVIDDASSDETYGTISRFILENHQEHRAILIRNEEKLGAVASLYRAIGSCSEREIILPLEGKNWLAHPMVLARLNAVYQDPKILLALGQAVHYPSYDLLEPCIPLLKTKKFPQQAPCCFYAGLFKQIELSAGDESYLAPLLQAAGGGFQLLHEPLLFFNESAAQGQRRP